MTVIEFVKTFKLPQRDLADRMEMNYTTFRKKINEAGNKFTDEEMDQLYTAVHDYVNDLNKNVQKHLPKLA